MISPGSTVKIRGRAGHAVVLALIPATPGGWRQPAFTVAFASGVVEDFPADRVTAR